METPEQVVVDAAAETGRQFAPPAAEPKSELQEQIDNAAEAAIEMEVPKVDGYGRNVSETVGNLYGAKITTDEMAGTIGRGELGLHVHR